MIPIRPPYLHPYVLQAMVNRLRGGYGVPVGLTPIDHNPTYQPPSPVPAPRGFVPRPVLNPVDRVPGPGPLPVGGLVGPNQPAQPVGGVVSADPYGGGGHGPILRSLLSLLHG